MLDHDWPLVVMSQKLVCNNKIEIEVECKGKADTCSKHSSVVKPKKIFLSVQGPVKKKKEKKKETVQYSSTDFQPGQLSDTIFNISLIIRIRIKKKI